MHILFEEWVYKDFQHYVLFSNFNGIIKTNKENYDNYNTFIP